MWTVVVMAREPEEGDPLACHNPPRERPDPAALLDGFNSPRLFTPWVHDMDILIVFSDQSDGIILPIRSVEDRSEQEDESSRTCFIRRNDDRFPLRHAAPPPRRGYSYFPIFGKG